MPHTKKAVRVAGTWLAIASLLMVVTFVFHRPIAHDLNDQMQRIAEGVIRWSAVHMVNSTVAFSALIVFSELKRRNI